MNSRSAGAAGVLALLTCVASYAQESSGQAGLRITSSDQSCIFKTGPESKSACEFHVAVFGKPPQPGGGVQIRAADSTETFGPGWNLGADGGWRVQKNHDGHAVFAARGIHQYSMSNVVCHAVGDCALIYGWGYSDGGIAAQADEGVTTATIQGGETNGYFHGRVKSGGVGAREPGLAFVSGNNWTTDGAFLLDIDEGRIAGSLNGYSRNMPAPFNSWLNYLPVEHVSLPVTAAWGEVLRVAGSDHAIPNPEVTANLSRPVTIRVRLETIGNSRPSFHSGGIVCVAGDEYPEQAPVVSVQPPIGGVQEITLEVRNPNRSAAIFQGGICGQFISFDTNLRVSGYRTSYYAFGSLTGADLIYGNNLAGGLGRLQIPDPTGSEAEEVTGPNAGFHLYPGAEIVMNRSTGAEPTLEPNSVDWAPGDQVENPHFTSQSGNGLWVVHRQNSPTSGYFKSQGIHLDVIGAGVSGAYHPVWVFNLQDPSFYKAGGGLLSAPAMFTAGGPYGDYFNLDFGPQPTVLGTNAVISIRHTAAGDNTPFNLFDLMRDHKEHAAKIAYDPATATTSFDFVRANGYLSAPVVVTTQGTPASSNVACVPNASWDDDDFHYHCLASGNSIKRVALSSF